MKSLRVQMSLMSSYGGDAWSMHAYKSQHACLQYVLFKIQSGQKLPNWSIVGNLTSSPLFVFDVMPTGDGVFVPPVHIRSRINHPHPSLVQIPSVNQRRGQNLCYAAFKGLIANHVLHGFDTGFVNSSILYVRYCSTFLIVSNQTGSQSERFAFDSHHKTKVWSTQDELHHNLAQYFHIWTQLKTRSTMWSSGLNDDTNQCEYTQLFACFGAHDTISFLGYTIKTYKELLYGTHDKTKMRIQCVITIDGIGVLESLADMGFCDRSGNPKPNFRYYQDSQYSAIARVSAILRGLACYYDLAQLPHDKRRCMTRWCYIVTHSLAMVFAAKFKLGTRARVFERAGRNLQKPLSAKKHRRRSN